MENDSLIQDPNTQEKANKPLVFDKASRAENGEKVFGTLLGKAITEAGNPKKKTKSVGLPGSGRTRMDTKENPLRAMSTADFGKLIEDKGNNPLTKG